MKLYSKYYNNTLYQFVYSEPGIEATACARELLYFYVYVLIWFVLLKPRSWSWHLRSWSWS